MSDASLKLSLIILSGSSSVGPDAAVIPELKCVYRDKEKMLDPDQAAFIVLAANNHDRLVEAIEEVLNSDMAQREEDEGQESKLLNKLRALLASIGGR